MSQSSVAVPRTGSQRAPVLIIGAHRSGTSATAEALQLLGLQIGQRLDSHAESRALQRLHEDYLRRVGASWHQPEAFLNWIATADGERDCADYLAKAVRQEFARTFAYRKNPRGLYLLGRLRFGAPWGWKEPRTTLFARIWHKLYPDAWIVDVIRHPLSVALSIRQRELRFRRAGDSPNPQLDDLHYCLKIALTYVREGERLAGVSRYRRVRFEDLQADAEMNLRELAQFCELRPTGLQLSRAAALIRPEESRHWHDLLKQETKDLLASYPALTKLGYSWE